MNEHELHEGLGALLQERTRLADVSSVHQQILATPIEQMPQQRSWLPQSPKWRFQSMLSATKYVVAGAIVALFGGFLLTSVMTQPSDEITPAAVSAAPSTSLDLVTEEVEPGVERILSDGIRDLSMVGPGQAQSHGEKDGLAVAPDGTVWLYVDEEAPTLIKLGDPGSFPAPSTPWPVLKVSPDGTLWAEAWGAGGSILRLGSEGWMKMAGMPGGQNIGWDLDSDGTVWTGGTSANVLRLGASGWQEHPIDLDFRQLMNDHPIAFAGRSELGLGAYFEDLMVDTNGDVWAALSVTDEAFAPMVLLRYDGETWSLVDPLGVGWYYAVYPLGVGSDGTIWVHLQAGRDASNEPEGHYLARLADDRWTVFSEEDGVGQLVWRAESHGLLRVDQDGAVWVAPQDEESPGVRAFDGKTWRQYLDGHDAIDMEVAPDGRVWVLTAHDLYRITPEAVAAAE